MGMSISIVRDEKEVASEGYGRGTFKETIELLTQLGFPTRIFNDTKTDIKSIQMYHNLTEKEYAMVESSLKKIKSKLATIYEWKDGQVKVKPLRKKEFIKTFNTEYDGTFIGMFKIGVPKSVSDWDNALMYVCPVESLLEFCTKLQPNDKIVIDP